MIFLLKGLGLLLSASLIFLGFRNCQRALQKFKEEKHLQVSKILNTAVEESLSLAFSIPTGKSEFLGGIACILGGIFIGYFSFVAKIQILM